MECDSGGCDRFWRYHWLSNQEWIEWTNVFLEDRTLWIGRRKFSLAIQALQVGPDNCQFIPAGAPEHADQEQD